MRRPASMWSLETLGRVRLSKYFYMRDMLHSEIGNFHGVPNVPDDPDLAIAAGRRLAVELLDPLHETFGCIAIRSAYRSAALNAFGNERKLNCGGNEGNRGVHIWDLRDAEGHMGACACVVVPWFADQYEKGRDWRDLAWWVHDHLPYSQMLFFPNLAAFNLTWNEAPLRAIRSWIKPHHLVLRGGESPAEPPGQRRRRYTDFPPFRGVAQPEIPARWA